MPIINRIAAYQEELAGWRQDLHAHPELGFQERRTADFVAERLAAFGVEVSRGLAGTGVVGTLRAGTSGRSIGLRADMDALPMTEDSTLPYRSVNDGLMHACGHDGHTTMLLGAARYLAETRNFDGTVQFIFQPAEEGFGGAKVMVDEGLFERHPVDAVYALHNDPGLPLGHAHVTPGTVQAASDRFRILLTGKGGHAARPHLGIDPVVVASHIVLALQSIASRGVDPLGSVVVSVTQFHSGSADNVIAQTAELRGTVRTLDLQVQDAVETLFHRIVTTTAEAHGAVAEVSYIRLYPPTINHPEQADKAADALRRIVPTVVTSQAPSSMGGEDFSFMLLKRPGAYVKIGQAMGETGATPLHHPRYDFNDALLPVGASFFSSLVEQELPKNG